MDWIQNYLKSQKDVLDNINSTDVLEIVHICTDALKNNKRIFVIGNGGSAANASHFVEDLGKGCNDAIHQNAVYKAASEFFGTQLGYFRPISLCDSVPYITAIGNDYCFEEVYLRQLISLAEPGDVLIGLSVSGTSPNLVKAFKWANKNNLNTVALTGLQGTRPKTGLDSIYTLANFSINIASTEYGIVEDSQMTILHMVTYYIIEKMG